MSKNELIDAIKGCEQHSTDADFKTLGVLIYRNRAFILDLFAKVEKMEYALKIANSVFRFDLRRMITWGDDFNQAVKDAANAVSNSL